VTIKVRRTILTFLTALSLTAGVSVSHAGNNYYNQAVCHRWGDGSGYCYGTWRAANESSRYDDSFSLTKATYNYGYTSISFSATLAGTSYWCTASSSTGNAVATAADALAGNRFLVYWDAWGKCSQLEMTKNSHSSW